MRTQRRAELNMQQNWRKYDEGKIKMVLNYEQELAGQKEGNCRQWEQHGQRATDQEKYTYYAVLNTPGFL